MGDIISDLMKLPTLSQNQDPTLRRMDRIIEQFIFLGILSFTCLVCCSCGTTRTIPVKTIKEVSKVDTIYLSNVQYDSIYVYESSSKDYHRGNLKLSETAEGMKRLETVDTIYIKDVATQFRYKLLRDTVERIKEVVLHDSIPYEVRIETVKEVPRPMTWFDRISRAAFWLLIGLIGIYIYRLYRKLKAL